MGLRRITWIALKMLVLAFVDNIDSVDAFSLHS